MRCDGDKYGKKNAGAKKKQAPLIAKLVERIYYDEVIKE